MSGVSRRPFDRFIESFTVEPGPLKSDCWIWQNKLSHNGYGKFNAGYDPVKKKYPIHWAHRWSYQHYKGDIPPGHDVHHLCENHACVNPKHLRTMPFKKHRSEAAKKMWAGRLK